MKKKVLVLGCTGSIGTSTLSIIREFSNEYSICGLTAHSNAETLYNLAKEFNCKALLTSSEASLEQFIIDSKADICVNGISGSAGLMPSVHCLKAGIDLALANKETIVMAGSIIKDLAKKHNCNIIPVDSEHSAIFSLITHYGRNNIDKIILTASGGPFRDSTYEELLNVTPEQALKHPTWDMGKKISIDSATLANKGLEVIEACRLFDLPCEQVKVTIHPQSLVHSFISTLDGDVYAQISKPTMKRPILSALSYPNMTANTIEKLDFSNLIEMSFSPPKTDLFPLLSLAFEAQSKGDAYTIAYNAANEIAVELFLQKKIQFLGIAKLVSLALKEHWLQNVNTIEDVFIIDTKVRAKTIELYESSQFSTFKIEKGDLK